MEKKKRKPLIYGTSCQKAVDCKFLETSRQAHASQ